MANNNKVIGSGRLREGGKSAVYKADFKYHVEGTGWRHGSVDIDMEPPISTFNNVFNAPTVQSTLQKIATFLSTIGQNYITIGDGYDTGDYNAPPLDNAFADALTNPRLQNGGVILIKAGTYRLNSTITVPAGITIMGEPRGTYIFGAMGENPMFHVEKSEKQFRIGGLTGTPLYTSDTIDQTKFYNLVLGDNTDGYYESGGVPIATMTTVPFIEAEAGSNILIEKVVFLGYLDAASPPITCSHRAISYTGSAPSEPTTLEVQHCLFDGLKSAIEFTPNEGRINTLRVEKCRAYLLGDTTSGDPEDTCFVSFVLCNAHFEGNDHHGLLNLQDRCFALLSTAAADPNVRVTLINNTGGLSNSISYSQDELSNFLANDNTTQTFECVNIGNSWGVNFNNDFFYTVGDGSNSVGDLTGPNALDIAIQRSEIGSGLTGANGTVIVNAGTYTMTQGSLSSKMNLIGNVKEGIRPTVTLNSTSGATDQASNPTQGLGHYISGIQFVSLTAAGFQSITIVDGSGAKNDRTQIVKDCRFVNCGLFFQNVTETHPYKINQIIDSCYFVQDNTLANNVGLYTNGANTVSINNCLFTGYGYAIGVGGASPFSADMQKVIISNCQLFMNDDGLTVKRISAASPLGISRYIFVRNGSADIEIFNTSIKTVEIYDTAANANILSGGVDVFGTFDKFIELSGKNIFIENSTIVGTSNTYTHTAVDYQLPTLWLEPRYNVYVNNTFIEGMLPLQISGSNAFSNGTNNRGQIYLSNSEFTSFSTDNVTTTCIDLDLPSISTGVTMYPNEQALVNINNCSLQNRKSTSGTNIPLEHVNNTGSYFDAIGVLMIFAEGWVINISNSFISGRMDDTLAAAAFVNATCVVIDTNCTGSTTGRININNSVLRLNGFQNSGTIAETMLTTLLRGYIINVNNNFMFLFGSAGGSSTNYNSYMWIDLSGSSSAMGNVSGNTFQATNESLGLAVVVIDSGSTGGGMFVDNNFSHIGTSTALTTLVFVDTTESWIFARNKNQTKSIRLRGDRGTFAFGNTNLGDFNTILGNANTFISYSAVGAIPGTTNWFYNPGSADIEYRWEISLDEALPHNVYVTNTSVSVVTDTLFSVFGNFDVEMYSSANAAGTYTDSADLSAVLSDALNITPASPQSEFKTGTSTLYPSIILTLDAESVSSAQVNIQVIVTYRW